MAIGPFGAAVFSGLAGLLGGERRNQASAAEARRNREFQERMSSSSHQREVADLRAAGLNPILSATGGSGASSPGGSMAQFQDVVTPAISTALTVRRFRQELKNLQKQEWLTDAQTFNVAQSTAESIQREDNYRRQGRLLDFSMPGAAIEANIDEGRFGEFFRMFRRFFSSGASSALSTAKMK